MVASIHQNLERWYQEKKIQTESDYLAWHLIDLFLKQDTQVATLERVFNEIEQKSRNVAKVYHDTQGFLALYGFELSHFMTEIAIASLQEGRGEQFAKLMKKLALETKLVSFFFLAAFIALNLGQWQKCIDICDEVETPFAPIMSMLGQAYLHAGEPIRAIEALDLSVQLNPGDILSWFQLAKAYYVTHNPEKAYDAIMVCYRFDPLNVEVCTFIAILANDHFYDKNWATLASTAGLAAIHREKNFCAPLTELVLWLTAKLGDQQHFAQACTKIPLEALADKLFVKEVGKILKFLGDKNLFSYADILLGALAPRKEFSSP